MPLLLLLGGRVDASPADLFGLGGESTARAGAMAASVQDASALYYNPAGLTGVGGVEVSLGVVGCGARLTVNGSPRGIAEPLAFTAAAAARVPFAAWLRDRLWIGVALHVLPSAIVRLIARRTDEPFFPLYDNRSQRLMILPGLALRIGWGLSLGVGVDYLAGLTGEVRAAEGATRALEARVDEQIFSTVKVNLGAQWRSPAARWALGLVYRQAFGVPFRTAARTRVAGQPIDLSVDAEGLYSPHTLVAGAAVRPRPWLAIEGDLALALWSRWRGPYVAVASELPLAGALTASVPNLAFRDTFALRLGGDARLPLPRGVELALRAGYAFETSPIPTDQPGTTNLLDAPKHTLALGLGAAIPVGASLRLRLDAHGQVQLLHPVTLRKRAAAPGSHLPAEQALADEAPDVDGFQSTNPGWPAIQGGGFAWAAGLTVTVAR